MYFPAPGFIAPLLREWEPRRLFNIISSSQYIIPQQILIYLQTRLRYTEREMRSKNREGGLRVSKRGREGGSCQSLWAQVIDAKRQKERQTYIVKPHHGVKLIQWQTPDGGLSPEVQCVSLSHEARHSARALLCHSFKSASPMSRPGSTSDACWTLRCCLGGFPVHPEKQNI